jgi:hypothetical protein
MYMLIMHMFSTIQTKVYANHDKKCDIESICCTKARVGWYKNLSKGFRNLRLSFAVNTAKLGHFAIMIILLNLSVFFLLSAQCDVMY